MVVTWFSSSPGCCGGRFCCRGAVDGSVVGFGAVGLAACGVGAGATVGYVEAISGGDLAFFIPWLLWGAFLL